MLRMRLVLAGIICFLVIFPIDASPGEWVAHHDLVFPPSAPSLGDVASANTVFLPGPATASNRKDWIANLNAWRLRTRNELGLRGDERPAGSDAWTRSAFTQDQVLVWDRDLYDLHSRRYTIEHFLAGVQSRVGKLDAVLLWPGYPNLGVDERNQFDLVRDMPGGIRGVRAMISAFHQQNVKVLLPYLAWDNGTRVDTDTPPVAMAKLAKALDADGVNFDGLNSAPDSFRQAGVAQNHPLALEPQFDIIDGSIAQSSISWDDWVAWEYTPYPTIPMVSKSKLLEPAHMVNVTDRYTRVKTDSLQHAFFNGQGYALLENLWGFWAGFSPRDAETVLRTSRIERTLPDLIASADWEPHVPVVQPGVFATKFMHGASTMWMLVNRNEFDVDGAQLVVPALPNVRYYDLWHGTELAVAAAGDRGTIDFPIDGNGYGAILALAGQPPSADLRELLSFMRDRSRRRIDSYSPTWIPTRQTLTPITRTVPAATPPSGMVRIPGGIYDFWVAGNEIEGGNDPGVDVQFPWETSARRSHQHRIRLASYFIDRTPVTNAEFKVFLSATHYHPFDDHNFLRDWIDRSYPAGWADKPVTLVSLEDARAFATWAGKRLPHDWEWQFAAQGTDGRLFPWGNDPDPARIPLVDHGRERLPPADVNAFPSGASSFGVLDLVGNVSQWTDEFTDEHTRAAIVRGGASYQPLGSVWYFPQTNRLDTHEKYLLASPGRDRAGTIGFRCVVDARQEDDRGVEGITGSGATAEAHDVALPL